MALAQDTITAAFARAVALCPERMFLDIHGERYSYRQVYLLSTQVAHGLAAAGIVKGDRVASLLDNGLETIVVWLAANKLGAISAPINGAYKGSYLQSHLNDCTAAVLVTEADYAGRVEEIAADLPALGRVYVVGQEARRMVGAIPFEPYPNLLGGGSEPIPDQATPDQVALLVYTSGTTGPSKGCMVPHNMVCNLAHGLIRARNYRGNDILWSCLPLFHLNAIAVSIATAIIAQCGVAVVKRFSVSSFWPEIERSGATAVSFLGSMATLLANAPDHEAAARCRGQLRVVQASPFAPEDAAKWRQRFGVDAWGAEGYGMTEACTITGILPGDPLPPPGSSGHSGIDFEVRIVDDDDNPLPPGSVGEIVCRPNKPNILFKGYWNKPAETLHAMRDLWFHTGDLGRLDEAGWLYFVDRKKDYIRRRGENISSMEMEAVFRTHPAIRDVAVHAVRSPLGEDEVKVSAERIPGQTLSEEALCRWAIDRLPYFAVPLYIEFRESLPRSATGKVLKEQLRSEGKTPATWDREAAGMTFERR